MIWWRVVCMALCLIVRTEGKAPRRYPLPNLLIHIGRSEENDVVLPSFSVSAHHATLSRTDDGFLLSDDGSKNGIVVAGARVPSALLMPMGSVAWLGDTALSIEEGETGEVRMAIAVENTAARTPERDTEVISKPDATTAMQLVADVARGRLDGPQEALARMRAILRATSAHCIEIVARREAAIVATSGPEVPADVRERIDKAGATPRWIERIGSTTIIAAVVELRHMRQIVLATFEGGPREFAPWEKAFFDSMAALLIDRNEAPPIAAVKPPQTERSDSFICESAAMKELSTPSGRPKARCVDESTDGRETGRGDMSPSLGWSRLVTRASLFPGARPVGGSQLNWIQTYRRPGKPTVSSALCAITRRRQTVVGRVRSPGRPSAAARYAGWGGHAQCRRWRTAGSEGSAGPGTR